MTVAAILAALGCAAAIAWALSERGARVRAERRADRRLELIGELRAEDRRLKQRVADMHDQMPRFRMPRPPLAHRADPDRTQVMKRGAA